MTRRTGADGTRSQEPLCRPRRPTDMVITATLRATVGLVLLCALAACADSPTGGGTRSGAVPLTPAQLPADPGALVLRVELVGGFVTPETTITRLPIYSLYADGRLFTDGPVPAIYPGPALPNVQVQTLDPATVQVLVDRAVAAGVAETGDLGTPNLADVPSTRFTLVTAAETSVRDVYALAEDGLAGEQQDAGLTDEQRAARAELRELVAALGELGQQLTPEGAPPVQPYAAESVAAIVRPWSAPEDDIAQRLAPEPVPWPGPPLPGEPVRRLPQLGCVTATGAEAEAVLTAATGANWLTPWSTSDGALWSVTFRPLLPDETGCADLTD